MRNLNCWLAIPLLILSNTAVAASTADLEARRKALNDLLHEQWEYLSLIHIFLWRIRFPQRSAVSLLRMFPLLTLFQVAPEIDIPLRGR